MRVPVDRYAGAGGPSYSGDRDDQAALCLIAPEQHHRSAHVHFVPARRQPLGRFFLTLSSSTINDSVISAAHHAEASLSIRYRTNRRSRVCMPRVNTTIAIIRAAPVPITIQRRTCLRSSRQVVRPSLTMVAGSVISCDRSNLLGFDVWVSNSMPSQPVRRRRTRAVKSCRYPSSLDGMRHRNSTCFTWGMFWNICLIQLEP